MRKKRTAKRKEQKKNNDTMGSKNRFLENPGIDPGTSRMQSGRSTISISIGRSTI